MTSPIRPPGAQPVEDSGEPGSPPRNSGSPRSYIRRPLRVDARRVTHDNAAAVAEWFGEGASVLANGCRIPVEVAGERFIVLAKPGHYVCIAESGDVSVLTPMQFAQSVKEVRP